MVIFVIDDFKQGWINYFEYNDSSKVESGTS